jgi:hypothetical protein
VRRDLGSVIIDEMTYAVMGDAPQFGPVPQGGDGGFLVLWENPAAAEADDVRELAFGGGRELRLHTPACRSSAASRGSPRSGSNGQRRSVRDGCGGSAGMLG